MINNGHCDAVCLNSACNNDGDDCLSQQCSDGCFPYMLSNSVCDSVCNTAGCAWDSPDCDCVPGCTTALATNAACDEACKSVQCGFDAGHCVIPSQGDCAVGCYLSMIGDRSCDPECDNEQCEWDGVDCGCAKNCRESDYGSCKAECLRPECRYDDTSGFPKCSDAVRVAAARVYQLLVASFEAAYSYEALCLPSAPTCTSWQLSLSSCYPECNTLPCLSSFGNCQSPCPVHCTRCVDLSHCIACESGFYQFFTECVSECPAYSEPVSGVCVFRTEQNETIYVSSAPGSGTGAVENPFHSVSEAFAASYGVENRILLLRGNHALTALVASTRLHSLSTAGLFPSPAATTITLEPLLCSEDNSVAECCEEAPVLTFDNLTPVRLMVAGRLTVRGIVFTGDSTLVLGCILGSCTYCPAVTGTGASIEDDRGRAIANYAPSSACERFHSWSLFTLANAAKLYLLNCTFRGFRSEFASLVQFASGKVYLEEVAFVNITTYTSVIWQTAALDESSSLRVEGGSVRLMNNGFEYGTGVRRGGFLFAVGLRNITIKGVVFEANIVGASGFLIYAKNLMVLRVTDSFFSLNVGALLYIDSDGSQPIDIDDTGNLRFYFNVEISSCTFQNNTGKGLYVSMAGDILSIRVFNCTYLYALAVSEHLIDVRVPRTLEPSEKQVARVGVYKTGVRFEVLIPPMNVTLDTVTFTSCAAPRVISISNVPAVVIRDVTVQSCGYSLSTINTNTLLALITYSGAYLSMPTSSAIPPVCVGITYLDSIFSADLQSLTISDSQCTSGSAGLQATIGSMTIRTLVLQRNTCKHATSATVLDLTTTSQSVIDHLKVADNVHGALTGKGVVSLAVAALTGAFTILHSELRSNTIPDGGTLNGSGNITLVSTVFESNACSGSTAAGVLYTPSVYGSALTFATATFRNNTAVTGGAIMLFDKAATRIPIDLTIQRSIFDKNRSQGSGSSLLVDSSIRLSSTSIIDNSRFTNNTAANGCIWVSFSTGILTVNNSVFSGTVGSNAAVLYGQHPRSLVPDLPSLVVLQNTVMEYGTGFATVYLSNPEKNSEGRSINITLRYNTGRGLWLQYTYWQETGSLFHNNTSPTAGAAFVIIFYSTAALSNSTYIGNTAKLTGGALSLSILSKVSVSNSLFFENNSERGGAVYAEQGLQLTMKSCVFKRNWSQKEGGAMYFFTGPLTSANSTVTDVLYEDNLSRTGMGTVSLISSMMIVERATFRRNKAVSASGFLLYISTLTVVSSTFSDQEAEQGVYIMSAASSSINVTNCSFASGTAVGKGGAVYISSTTLYLSKSRFSDLQASSGAAVAAFAESILQITASEFVRLTATITYGGAVLVSETVLSDSGSRYKEVHNGVMVGLSADVYVSGDLLEDAVSKSGAGLYCLDCHHVDLRRSSFLRMVAETGASLHLVNTLATNLFNLENSEFAHSVAGNAGAALLQNIGGTISGCRFFNNTAQASNSLLGDGGALHLICTLQQCPTNITDTVFIQNSADRNGGAIYWTEDKPQLSNVSFEGNRAKYGTDMASFAVSLSLNDSAETGIEYELESVGSGQESLYVLEVVLVDHYGQVVSTDSASLADIFPANSSAAGVTGPTRVQAVAGHFRFSGYTVTASPGHTATLLISTTAIDAGKVILSDLEVTYTPTLEILAHMRNCTSGESLVGITCFVCPEGKYSLDPAQPCTECPDGAVCYGNSTMAPKAGYWRSSRNSSVFWECPNRDSCLGSSDDHLSLTGNCAAGYYGNLCQGCVSGYSRSQKNYCAQCPGEAASLAQLIGIVIAVAAACIFIIKMSLLSAYKQQSQSSIFLKIFVNYLQLAAATSSFNMNWPKFALQSFQVQDSVANVSMQVFSFDCLLDDGSQSTQEDAFYAKTIVIAAIPLLILALSLSFWSCVGVVTRKKGYLKYHMVNSVVVLFFIAHPSIVTFMFDVFNCREIDDGQYWLNSYLNIRCWDKLHYRTAMLIALPSLLLWGVCTPLVALITLMVQKKRLFELHVRIRLGFLYTGYDVSKYFWEFVIMYRKMIIITMSVFLTNISTSVQVLGVLFVLVVAFVLQTRNSPYSAQVFNHLERRSILVSAVTIYCGLFYMSRDLDYTSGVLLFTVMLVVNAYFLVYWLLRICQVGLRFIAQRCVFLRRFLSSFQYLMQKNEQVRPAQSDDSNLSFSIDRSSVQRAVPISDKSLDVPNNSVSPVSSVSHVTPTLGAKQQLKVVEL